MRLMTMAAVVAAGCAGTPGGGDAPAGDAPAWARQAVDDWARSEGGGHKCRFVKWGPSWKASPAHLKFLREKPEKFATLFGGDLDRDVPYPAPPVAYAVEASMRYWREGTTDHGDVDRLFLFGEDNKLIAVALLRIAGSENGGWKKRIADDPYAAP